MIKAFVGIDPGLGGAIAAIFSNGEVDILPTPVAGKEIDITAIAAWIAQHKFTFTFESVQCTAYIESVHSMPEQGVSSSFKFGFVTGVMHGVFRANFIPLYLVTPQAWKKEILAGTDKSKQACIDWCVRAYPNVKLFKTERSRTYNDGMADALAIAEYGRRMNENRK